MKLKEKYTTDELEQDKVLLNNDAYAMCEFIEDLTHIIKNLKIQLIK